MHFIQEATLAPTRDTRRVSQLSLCIALFYYPGRSWGIHATVGRKSDERNKIAS